MNTGRKINKLSSLFKNFGFIPVAIFLAVFGVSFASIILFPSVAKAQTCTVKVAYDGLTEDNANCTNGLWRICSTIDGTSQTYPYAGPAGDYICRINILKSTYLQQCTASNFTCLPPPTVTSHYFTPNPIFPGQTSNYHYTSSNATGCNITHPGGLWPNPGLPPSLDTGYVTWDAYAQPGNPLVTYLDCYNGAGVHASLSTSVLTISYPLPVITNLTVTPSPVPYNGTANINFSCNNTMYSRALMDGANISYGGSNQEGYFSNGVYHAGPLTSVGAHTITLYCWNNDWAVTSASYPLTVSSPPPVNGVCAATHYSCSAGTSANNAVQTTSWTWSCVGLNGGTTASCSETVPQPTGLNASCNASGNLISVSWGAPSGYTRFYTRAHKPASDGLVGPSGPGWNEDYVGTSYSFATSPGTWNVWVHTKTSAATPYSDLVSTTVTCNQPSYTITASAGAGGTISPSGAVSVSSGGSQQFTVTPNAGYAISTVLVDGVDQSHSNPSSPPYSPSTITYTAYNFLNVTANHTITASFYATPTLSVSASPNPTSYGTASTLSWTPANATWCTGNPWPTVGSKSASGGTEPTGNLTALSTTYTMKCGNVFDSSYDVTRSVAVTIPPPVTAQTHTPSPDGTSATVSWTPASGWTNLFYVRFRNIDSSLLSPNADKNEYTSSSYTVNGLIPGQSYLWWVHSEASNGAYSNATAVSFTTPIPTCGNGANNYPSCNSCTNSYWNGSSCVACSNGGCTGTSPGTLTCNNGANNPPSCDMYNSCSATTIGNCTLPLTSSGNSAGSCSSGYSGSCNYTCTNGTWSQNSNSCVAAYTITASSGTGGTILPSGPVSVTVGNNQAFNASPNTDYDFSYFLVDGTNYFYPASYTFTNVQSAHTIDAYFTYNPRVAGQCGLANGVPIAKRPSSNLCNPGTILDPPGVTGSGVGPWSWTCSGLNGGGSSSCGAPTSCGNGVFEPAKGETALNCAPDFLMSYFEF